MRGKRIIFTVSILGLIIISSAIIGILRPWNKGEEIIEITFIPDEILSYPGHTAWILANINVNYPKPITDFNLKIDINTTIDYDNKTWFNTEKNGLVEIFLYPNQTHLEKSLEVNLTVTNNEISKSCTSIVSVVNWTIEVTTEILEMQDEFILFLENNYPSFNINGSTSWESFGNAPMILIVSHYLFKSECWEMELARHVTIAPHDWVKIYLRPRNSTQPLWYGIINSWNSGNHTIEVIDPPEEIFR